jgi:hypothetical protein
MLGVKEIHNQENIQLIFQPLKWMPYSVSKRWIFSGLHSVTTQNTAPFGHRENLKINVNDYWFINATIIDFETLQKAVTWQEKK